MPRPKSERPLPLTERQKRILNYMAEGDSNKVSARRLGIAEATMKVHRKSIYSRLGARNGLHALAIAFRAGIIPMQGPESP